MVVFKIAEERSLKEKSSRNDIYTKPNNEELEL